MVDGGEVDAHRPEPRGPHGERGGEQHLLVGLAAEPTDPVGDVDVGRVEHACLR